MPGLPVIDFDAQLERMWERQAAKAGNGVFIYQLDRGFSVWVWLCTPHVEARTKVSLPDSERWDVKERRVPKHPLTCDDCPRPV